ncbi:hypothetical protein CF54_04155 [Streptomyces sp. Tu 6176]|uniref:hypothetical protein n=1 Tax=Streptomyces sp. Tu 6176 TaxID=1470557 RepID=UPI00044E555D|nr:hypothetical protein [Streptomyces sp. Tu 6176]EYT83972.1 hypothetical protein CF54_04155 [Streptomyces sp. Tu 6176]
MTAPARIPTPGDLARRTPASAVPAPQPRATAPRAARTVTAADLIAPGRLRHGELLRHTYQRGMRISGMTPATRLVALTLLGYAHGKTGLLNKHAPNTDQLANATGLSAGQVRVQLEILTQRGWLTQHTPASGPRQGQHVLQLCIPAAALHQVRTHQDLEPAS